QTHGFHSLKGRNYPIECKLNHHTDIVFDVVHLIGRQDLSPRSALPHQMPTPTRLRLALIQLKENSSVYLFYIESIWDRHFNYEREVLFIEEVEETIRGIHFRIPVLQHFGSSRKNAVGNI